MAFPVGVSFEFSGPSVIARSEATKQSRLFPRRDLWIASLTLAMTAARADLPSYPKRRPLLLCTSTIRHGREALNQDRPGGSHAVSNHDRGLAAEAGMARRAEHSLGALEIARCRARARQARRDAARAQASGGCRHRH